MLDDEGFERRGIKVSYCGAEVGKHWHNELELVNEYPGISCKSYENADKTVVKYKDKEAEEKITAAIRTLKESYRKYEQKMRDDKVSAVKRYFDLRKTQKMINDIPLEPDIPQEPALW
jgi:hypothetical protein